MGLKVYAGVILVLHAIETFILNTILGNKSQ